MYYPKSKIVPNQYANPGELVYKDGSDSFEGYYHILASGRIFSGKTPSDGIPVELVFLPPSDTYNTSSPTTFVLYDFSVSKLSYDNLRLSKTKQYPPVELIEPYYYQPTPGYPSFTRYCVKRVNSTIFIEINEKQYNFFKSKNQLYNWPCYIAFVIPWTTAGNVNVDLEDTNKKMVLLIEKKLNLTGLSKYITNYREFTL